MSKISKALVFHIAVSLSLQIVGFVYGGKNGALIGLVCSGIFFMFIPITIITISEFGDD